jgi:la-related protein 1
MKVLLISMILLCSNQSINSLKLVSINHINNIDLTTEARLVNSALADVSSTIKSSHSFIGVDEAESILKQKSFQRLRNSIDRWNQIGDRFNNAKNNNQQSLLDEVSKSIAISKALIGHFLYRSKQEKKALPLLESACPLLWGNIHDMEIDILLDCYTALGNMYLKNDMQTSLEAIQIDLITNMPWLKYTLIDNAIEKSHTFELNSIELIKLVIDLTVIEREIISTETRRAWTTIDEIRLSMNTLVAEFSVSNSKEKKLSVLNKSKQIVDDLLERHKIASVEAMKKLVNQLKNSTIASNDIPQGLNEGNVDEHIIKISSSIIDYLKVEIEKEAIYYLDIMEGVIDNGKLYIYSQVMNRGNTLFSNLNQRSHGFQSKAEVYQVMEYIITKHENYNPNNSFAPFSNKKNPKSEKNNNQSIKKSNDKDKDKDNKKNKFKSKNGFYDSYSIVISAIVGIAILGITKLLKNVSNKQNLTRVNKSKRFNKVATHAESKYLAFLKRTQQFFNYFLKYERKAASDISSEILDELILQELIEKDKSTKKLSGKKEKNLKDSKASKKKKNDSNTTTESKTESKSGHEMNEKNKTASDELRNVSSSSSDMPSYPKHYYDNNKSSGTSSLSVNTTLSQYNDINDYMYSIISSNDNDEKWIGVTGNQNRKKTKSPTDKLPVTPPRKENSNFDSKNSKSQKNNKNFQNQEKNKAKPKPKALGISPTTTDVSNNLSKSPSSSKASPKDYRPISSTELPTNKSVLGYSTSPSSSSSPSNCVSQPSVSSTDIEDRSTDDSDQSIDNDQSPFISQEQQQQQQQQLQYFMRHPNFQGFTNEIPLNGIPGGETLPVNPIMNNNNFYGTGIPQFPTNGNVMNPPMYTFQGPDGQVYIMPHPMQMHPYLPQMPPDVSCFIPQMPPPYNIHPGNFTSTTPPLPTESRDELISRIRLQIEYYFSDENLSKDQYLKSNMDDDGYVPLAKINSFRRIQQLRADTSMVLEAVKASSKLLVIESIGDDEGIENNLEKTKICSITWKK